MISSMALDVSHPLVECLAFLEKLLSSRDDAADAVYFHESTKYVYV